MLVGVQVRIGATDSKLVPVRHRKAIEQTARSILSGELAVHRPGRK